MHGEIQQIHQANSPKRAQQLVQILTDLGPTFIKIGQAPAPAGGAPQKSSFCDGQIREVYGDDGMMMGWYAFDTFGFLNYTHNEL